MSLVGNTLVILTVLINKPMQTTFNYLLVNLAVADMVFAFSILISYLIIPFITRRTDRTISLYIYRRWRYRVDWRCSGIHSVFGVHCC